MLNGYNSRDSAGVQNIKEFYFIQLYVLHMTKTNRLEILIIVMSNFYVCVCGWGWGGGGGGLNRNYTSVTQNSENNTEMYAK